jgi:hypothetical protein
MFLSGGDPFLILIIVSNIISFQTASVFIKQPKAVGQNFLVNVDSHFHGNDKLKNVFRQTKRHFDTTDCVCRRSLTEFFSKLVFPPDKDTRVQAAKEEQILKTRE